MSLNNNEQDCVKMQIISKLSSVTTISHTRTKKYAGRAKCGQNRQKIQDSHQNNH